MSTNRGQAARYLKHESTRLRLIDAAVSQFGELGFAGASIRCIARLAGMSAHALHYYFENKEGLYLACSRHVLAQVQAQIDGALRRVERLAGNALTTDSRLIEAYLGLLDCFFSVPRCGLRFMVTEHYETSPLAPFGLIDHTLDQRLGRTARRVVARLTGDTEEGDATRIQALALSGQALAVGVLHFLPPHIDPADRHWQLLRRTLLAQHRTTLRALANARDRAQGVRPA